jgi:tetratricopeptide (TPR) repeat protein
LEGGFAYEEQNAVRQAVDFWEMAGIDVKDWLEKGEEAQQKKRFSDAFLWFERVQVMEPSLSDPYYYIGVTFQDIGKFEEALIAFQKAIEIGLFQTVFQSDVYYKMGIIYQTDTSLQNRGLALEMYAQALMVNRFSSVALHDLA